MDVRPVAAQSNGASEGAPAGSGLAGRNSTRLWDLLAESLEGLRYGQVTLVVQDGVVVQIDRMERHRLSEPPRVA